MKVVITGASQGLGKGFAEKFAANGADLFLVSRNMDKHTHWVKDLMGKYGVSVSTFNADLSLKADVNAFADAVISGFGAVDVLINNAGKYEPGNVHDEADGALERTMDLNLYSAYHLTRRLLPMMMKAGSGHIFNICSIAALKAYPGGGSYSISKFALDGFTKNLREEMKPHGIKVTAVHPGAVWTPAWEGFVERSRIMEVSDIAEMIWAASQLSAKACVEEIVIRPQLGDV
jgi:short-subunit dehydrogenase